MKRVLTVLLLSVAACGPDPGGGGGSRDGAPVIPPIQNGLVITPTNSLIELDLGATTAQTFVATRYRNGEPQDVTTEATWVVDNPAVGAMSGSTLNIPAFVTANAVSSRVRATVDDLAAEAQITVAAYQRSGPRPDFFFVLPFMDPAGPAQRPLDFSTEVPALDVFFLMDTTGSMLPSIVNLQNQLTNTIVPQIRSAVANTHFGVGSFEDFPWSFYGNTNAAACPGGLPRPDQPFRLFQPITEDIAAVQTGVGRLRNGNAPIGCGYLLPESGAEAIYQAATGDGLSGPGATSVAANHTGRGGAAFREGAMPVIVPISDAVWHATGAPGVCTDNRTFSIPLGYAPPVSDVAHSKEQAKQAVRSLCGRVVGIAVIRDDTPASCRPIADMESFATDTGALVPPAAWDVGTRPAGCGPGMCCTGVGGVGRAPNAAGLCPLTFLVDRNGGGVSASIATGIQMLARFATFDVSREHSGEPGDLAGNPLPAPHTTADFLKAITPTSFALPPPPPNLPTPTFDANGFFTVTPGTTVSFSITAFNDFAPTTGVAQFFRAKIRVVAGGCTALDERDVLILVPPTPVDVVD